MKAKATSNKGPKETSSRKTKKQDQKANLYGKEKVEDKKQRRPIQKNRFTNIEELSPSAFELFGSLVFNFAKETSDVHISDSTGDYELRVSNETLKEFKLKVLLGIDQRSKPKFTILLGDCQCYPELLEGPLVKKKVRMNMDDESVNKKYTAEKIGFTDTESIHPGVNEGVLRTESLSEDVAAESLRGTVNGTDSESIMRSLLGNVFSKQQTERGETPCSDDERTIQSSKTTRSRNVEEVQNPLNIEHNNVAQNVRLRSSRIRDSASTYMNNLEGFVKFLINDEICYSALKKTRAPSNLTKVTRRIVGGRNMIRYSDGREFVITFEEKDATDNVGKVTPEGKNESSDCPPNSIKSESESSLTTLKELLSTRDDTTGRKLEEELRAREELMEANEFVENVKKELIEWKARCDDGVDVTIIGSETPVALKVPNENDNNVNIGVSNVLKSALQKVDDVYEDATSNSSNLAQADSLEHFFLELDEYDKMTVSKDAKDIVTRENTEHGSLTLDVLNDATPNATSAGDWSHMKHRYIPPKPLNMTSKADIELMWMSFVKQFHSDDERLKTSNPDYTESNQRLFKSDLHFRPHQQRLSDVECSTSRIWKSGSINDLYRKNSFDDNIYPGQHCYPYFVEANLRRVNSVVSSFKVSSTHTSQVNQPEHDFPLLGYPQFHSDASHPKNNFPARVCVLNPSKLNPQLDRRGNCPLQGNSITLPQERSQNRHNRIFFNPNVSAGDWY